MTVKLTVTATEKATTIKAVWATQPHTAKAEKDGHLRRKATGLWFGWRDLIQSMPGVDADLTSVSKGHERTDTLTIHHY